MSLSDLKHSLRKYDFPMCAKEALNKIEQLLVGRAAPSNKQLDIAMDIIAEFIFYESDRRGGRRSSGLTPLQELQLIEIMCDYLSSCTNETTKNTVFLSLFGGMESQRRLKILSILASMAVSASSTTYIVTAAMEILVANVDHIKFDIDYALEEQYGALPLPFPGMDKSTAAVCEFFSQPSGCGNGPQCPYRHVRGDRTVVCKHWLRGLCKKGDQCEFLHEYDMSKMPECYFYARFNACHNKECPFLHIDPESKIKDCPWYDRGFCRHGPHCRHRHVRRVFCMNYLAGFCPEGPTCKYMHPRFELPAPPEQTKDAKRLPVCHYCSEVGHKASTCHKIPPEQREAAQRQEEARYRALGYVKPASENEELPGQRLQRITHKPLEEVTCFKCGTKGHYANKCPKGHLAFLSSQSSQNNQNMFKKPN